MLYPSYTDLMDAVNSGSDPDHPIVQSRYSVVMASAKRARQLVNGAEPLVEESDMKPLSTAIKEINQKQVTIVGKDDES